MRSRWMRSVFAESKVYEGAESGQPTARSHAEEEDKIDQLIQLGFPRVWAQVALDLNGGDVENALNYILNNANTLQEMSGEEVEENSYGDEEGEEEGMGDADELMRHLDELNMEVDQFGEAGRRREETPESRGRREIPPKEFHYDDRRMLILPIYAAPSLQADKVGCLFPGDSLYVMEEVQGESRDAWMKVRLSDYEDEFDAPEREDPFAWVPRYIEGAEVILTGCSSDLQGNLADPPAPMYAHHASYEVVGGEGAILREGVDLTSRELRVIACGNVLRCDTETINFDGTFRLHVIDPFLGWVSKKRHLVRKVEIDRSRDALLTDFGRTTLEDRYLLPGESYQDMFARVATAFADDAEHAQRIYDYISRLWFMPATPVLSNGGASRGLPISCFLNAVGDSLESIVGTWNQNVWLAANGGGIRQQGAADPHRKFFRRVAL